MKNATMKRLLFLILIFVFAFVLFGCGKSDTPAPQVTEGTQTPVIEEKDLFYFNIDKVLNPSVVRQKERVSGLYTIRLLKDGKMVEYQTPRDNIASQVDNLRAVVLTFDDEGYIKKLQSAQSALGGQFFDQLRVLSVEGNTCQVDGGSGTMTIAEDASIYDLTGRSMAIGGYGQVQAEDIIACYAGEDKVVTQVYILQRYENHEENHTCAHCGSAVEWVEWDGSAPLTTGHYCLNGDVTMEAAQALKNADVVLCLNGHHVSSKQRLFELSNNASLSIIDHAGFAGGFYGSMTGGGLKIKDTDPNDLIGGSFYVDKTSALKIYGGNISTSFPIDKSSYVNMGGVIYTEGTFELIDGVITGADVGYSGGAVYIGQNATFKMSGGVMQYGSAYKQDKISGTGRGGTMVIHKDAQLAEITGGKIIAGIVDGYGGGIYTEHDLTISNAELCGDHIDGTVQAEYGGVIWAGGQDTILDLKEGTVFHSGSSIEGGNVAVRLNCVVNVHDGVVIRDGYGSRNGGNVAVFGTFNVLGGQIKDGQSDGSGGNIFSYSNGNTHVNIEGGSVTNGNAARGGNICMSGTLTYEEGSILTVTGGEISGGIATKYDGGNIALRVHSIANITGGKITGGSATQFGGGLSTEYTKDSEVATGLNIGGGAYIFENVGSDVYLVDHTVISMLLDAPLTGDAKIGVDAFNISVPLIEHAYEKCLNAFVWTPGEKSLAFENEQIFVK